MDVEEQDRVGADFEVSTLREDSSGAIAQSPRNESRKQARWTPPGGRMLQLWRTAGGILSTTTDPMKTALISFLAATVFGLVSLASGAFDAAEFVSLSFAAGLAAWTLSQYARAFRPLTLARPIRFPAPLGVRHAALQVGRLAA